MTTQRLTARAAIDHAAAHGLTLNKFADPTEGAREGLTVAEAREIAAQDPSLIYCDVPTARLFVCAVDSDEPQAWQDHQSIVSLTPADQTDDVCSYRVDTIDLDALRAVLDADDDVLAYSSI